MKALDAYPWPGNVRELRRVLRHAAERARLQGRDTVEREDLPDEIQRPAPAAAADTAGPSNPESPHPDAAPRDARGASKSAADAVAGGLVARGLSEREAAEILALRAAGFRVGAAEAMLGYSSKSRTFSHRLRGLSLKLLSLSDWNPDAAAGLMAGENHTLVAVAARRLRNLVDGIAARLDEPDERLLENLLIEHRRYALEAATVLRRVRRPADA
jgi:hypothetical protein